jgi:hypothetical protein
MLLRLASETSEGEGGDNGDGGDGGDHGGDVAVHGEETLEEARLKLIGLAR